MTIEKIQADLQNLLTILQSQDMRQNETSTTASRTATSFTITNHRGTTAHSQTINSHPSKHLTNQITNQLIIRK